MEKEEVQLVGQLIRALDDSVIKLEDSFKRKDAGEFNKIKMEILDIQKRVSEILK